MSRPARVGSADRDAPVAVAEEAARVLAAAGADVTLTVVDGAGHHLPLERPGAVRAAVEELAGC